MNNITTIVCSWTINNLEQVCIDRGITFAKDIPDSSEIKPENVLIVRLLQNMSEYETFNYLRKGYKIGAPLTELRSVFNGLPDWGNCEEIEVGIISFATGETLEWEVPDTYDKDRAAWVEDHTGTRKCSCGHVFDCDSDFSHGCGENTCYMCS